MPSASFDTGSLMAELNKPLMAVTTPELYMSTSVFGTYKQANETIWGNAENYLLASNDNSGKLVKPIKSMVSATTATLPVSAMFPSITTTNTTSSSAQPYSSPGRGNRTYFDESDILAWHFMDVDVLHASNNPLNEGGQHMHFTDHAKGETHAGHCSVEGLWYYYMLTGEPRAKEVATGIADFFAKIAAYKNFLDFRDDEERPIGWALRACPSYRATLNPRYKLAAQMIVEQAIAGRISIPATGTIRSTRTRTNTAPSASVENPGWWASSSRA